MTDRERALVGAARLALAEMRTAITRPKEWASNLASRGRFLDALDPLSAALRQYEEPKR